MRILCLIDNLASGGAQRQLVTLARLLSQGGDEVAVATYYPHEFFRKELEANGIPHHLLHVPNKVMRIAAFWRFVRKQNPDVVLAFLPTPSILAELAALPVRRFGVVVSERNAPVNVSAAKQLPRLLLHAVADAVVSNSHTNRLMVEQAAPWLKGKIRTVYNTVDLTHFRPTRLPSEHTLRLVGVGRFAPQKNIPALLVGLSEVLRRGRHTNLHLDWYGDSFKDKEGCLTSASGEYAKVAGLIEELNLSEHVALHEPVEDIRSVYQGASALILPSIFEGLPNVVCEAMACGRPILATDTCDHSNLVTHGENGFLIPGFEPEAIASSIEKLGACSSTERQRMGEESRRRAEALFSAGPFLKRYREILESSANRTAPQPGHWPEEVPQSALNMLGRIQRAKTVTRTQ